MIKYGFCTNVPLKENRLLIWSDNFIVKTAIVGYNHIIFYTGMFLWNYFIYFKSVLVFYKDHNQFVFTDFI